MTCDKGEAAEMKGKGPSERSEISALVWFRDDGTDQKTGSRTESDKIRFRTRLGRISSEHIRGTDSTDRTFWRHKVREARLRWFGHMPRRESEHIGRRMLTMALPGSRQSRRPERSVMDVVREDMEIVGVTEEDAGW